MVDTAARESAVYSLRGCGGSVSAKVAAVALAGPLAGLIWVGLLALRGPQEMFETGEPLPPPFVASYQDAEAITPWPYPRDWPMFGHDPHHSGSVAVDFASADLVAAWPEPFTIARAADWNVDRAACVWSPVVVGQVARPTAEGVIRRQPLVVVGSFDRSVYALDGRNGALVWRFGLSSEGGVTSSPALVELADGRALVIAAANDRHIYALEAASGQPAWTFEVRPWSQSTGPSVMSSVTVVRRFGEVLAFVGVWSAERAASGNAQDGELLALKADTGQVAWRVRLGTSAVTTPAAGALRGGRGGLTVFAASEDGVIRAVDGRNGRVLWHRTLHQELRGSPTLALSGEDVATVLIGTRFQSLYALGAAAGAKLWLFQTGYWVDATPAVAGGPDGPLVIAPSYDARVYGLPVTGAGRLRQAAWRFASPRGAEMRTSPAVAGVAGRPGVFVMGFDDTLHLLEAATGRPLWEFRAGPLIFSHEFQGDSLWSGPTVADWGDGARVFFPALDGKLYAFAARSGRP